MAFDIGGTFTDVVIALGDGRLATFKILSLPQDLGENIAACIENARTGEHRNGSVSGIVHATTIASNAVVELSGAKTGLITTQGIRDELEIRRFIRPTVTGYFWERKPPLVPRRRRVTISERIGAGGEIVEPLDEADLLRAASILEAQGVEAVAISLLNSYVNPEHELQAARIVRERLPDCWVAVSAEVLPEIGEYERTSTTALTAYLAPKVGAYLTDLETATKRYHRSLFIMQANGGVVPSERARSFPAAIVESGPAAGVLAACIVARNLNIEHAVSFDMGGTTVKAMLIENGEAREKASMEVGGDGLVPGAGYALRISGFDLVEIGAGGGSIASFDDGGALRVGPRSAGAVPGPVCYARGGTQPTVTDANVVLGYMNPEVLAGGTVPIDRAAAIRAFETTLCPRLKLPVERAALGVHQIANVTMMRALRAVTTERGQDPRACTLIAFGGAGPIHAAHLAEGLEISRVVIPPHPGLFSALGLLLAELRFDYVQSLPGKLDDADPARLLATYEALLVKANDELRALGLDPAGARWSRFVDLHYQRQTMQLSIPFPDDPGIDPIQGLARRFTTEHRRVYAYENSKEPIAIRNLRIRVTAPGCNLNLEQIGETFLARGMPVTEGSRNVYFGRDGEATEARILSRAALARSDVTGPAILEEFDTTVVVPPGWRASLDRFANILLART